MHDALKKMKTVTHLISKARNLVKKLRTQTFMYLISKQKFKKPIIDCLTRWCSTIDILENLLLLKDFCQELTVTNFQNFVTLRDDEWKKIEEICVALRPSKICTMKLQSEQLTLSDFFGIWYETKLATEAIRTSFAVFIVQQMKFREQKLLDNDVLLSAVFMDPRYKILLDKTQIERAKNHLKDVWAKMITINHDENLNKTDNDASSSNSSVHSNSSTASTHDEFENILRLKERQHHLVNLCLTSSRESDLFFLRQIEHKLQAYDIEQKRLNRRSNILQFWNEQNNNQPELYKLAMIVLSVPATQVSVERLFSGLKFILSPLRTNTKEDILEDQLLVGANRMFSTEERK